VSLLEVDELEDVDGVTGIVVAAIVV
jgi:hypothetical protein